MEGRKKTFGSSRVSKYIELIHVHKKERLRSLDLSLNSGEKGLRVKQRIEGTLQQRIGVTLRRLRSP